PWRRLAYSWAIQTARHLRIDGSIAAPATLFVARLVHLLIESGTRKNPRMPQEVSPMLKRAIAFAAVFVLSAATVQFAQPRPQPVARQYLMPPREIVAAFDAPVLPTAILSPSKQVMALSYRRNYPTIAE